MTRKETWVEDLHEFVQVRATVPFMWGLNDCCLFMADALKAMTGVDIDAEKEFRGNYDDERSAFVLIRKVTGGSTVEDVCNYLFPKHGITELDGVLFAQRGDIVLFDGELGLSIGIVHLNGKDAMFVSTDGLNVIPLAECKKAWRLG